MNGPSFAGTASSKLRPAPPRGHPGQRGEQVNSPLQNGRDLRGVLQRGCHRFYCLFVVAVAAAVAFNHPPHFREDSWLMPRVCWRSWLARSCRAS